MTDQRLQDRMDAQNLLRMNDEMDLSCVRDNLRLIAERGFARRRICTPSSRRCSRREKRRETRPPGASWAPQDHDLRRRAMARARGGVTRVSGVLAGCSQERLTARRELAAFAEESGNLTQLLVARRLHWVSAVARKRALITRQKGSSCLSSYSSFSV